jgi:hypothetical protein
LTGCFPFYEENNDFSALYRKILSLDYTFPEEPQLSDEGLLSFFFLFLSFLLRSSFFVSDFLGFFCFGQKKKKSKKLYQHTARQVSQETKGL